MSDESKKSLATEREERILAFWQKHKIFEETLEREPQKGEFVFYDGPPFANGLPHYGHLLASFLKDTIPRYKTMQGHRVRRRWGWDCHGLPVENLVEKELGLKSKKDIEELGIDKFNDACRASVLRHTAEWCSIIPRVGRWVDMVNDYRTMDTSYTESVWWAFKTLYDKGLVYQGFKSMHLCPRCETTLSNFEVNQGYKDITDISVYVKFELVDEPNTFLLAWTTTPWTLPGNTAVAVNKDITYVKVNVDDTVLILSKDSVERVIGKEAKVIEELSGELLLGKTYKPIFEYYKDANVPNKESIWKVWHADFVTTEKGTGIAHEAPAFGEEDYQLSLANNFPFIQHVGKDGRFKPEVADFAGQFVKPKEDHQQTDVEIIKWLAKEKKLFKKEKIVHSYPHCWRCDTPLLNYATSSWFVRVTDLRDKLVEANNQVKWVPEAIGKNRFGTWLEEARDWNVSRQRYWGAPIPVWQCASCEGKQVIGSIADIKTLRRPRNKYIVMRHGEGEHNVAYVVSSDQHKKYHLTEKGMEEVRISAQGLKDENIDLIYTSPITRTKETAAIVVETIAYKGEVIEDARLREDDFGEYDGKSVEEYHRFFDGVKEVLDKRLPGGESVRDVARRAAEFIYEIDNKYEGKNILIVTHDGPASMLFAIADGGDDKKLVNNWAGDYLETAHYKKLEFVQMPHNENYAFDLHRPHIDGVEFSCACGGVMKRVPDVFDCWFESGSMPFAEVHYPFEHHDDFKPTHFPADFIAEGLDQTRGWFYSSLVLGVALFGESPYRNVIVNGLVLAEDGQKMAKSKQNYPDPMYVVNTYGADALRYYLLSSPVVKAEDLRFVEKGVDEVNKKILLRLQNVVSFYDMYSHNSQFTIHNSQTYSHILDEWIISRLNEMINTITTFLDKYEVDRAMRPIAEFIDDLSTWYLRRSRERFKGDDAQDRDAALATTRYVLLELAKVIAPVMPFYAEELYRKAKGEKKSVHLESWPLAQAAGNNSELIEKMQKTREVVEKGLAIRNEKNIKVRQPLQSFTIETPLENVFAEIIADELNVKEVVKGEKNELDTNLTPELVVEGNMRELVRAIQDTRKKENWLIGDQGKLTLPITQEKDLSKFLDEIKKIAGLKEIMFADIDASFILEKI